MYLAQSTNWGHHLIFYVPYWRQVVNLNRCTLALQITLPNRLNKLYFTDDI